ncbi:tRNA (adenosine(37)-N6)-threonylcarbamoyltransferase complex dimerization subunit type 1 TsaB [Aliivibrio sp. S4TY2]|uniref:tRNA (adenosine(37)-N6)-threonylcarbamoyltransferase complex dimerization subunit type 1 TsaB n=1 Tax=unclassified Aliivibrio TaxID=2645654 RepID=UPI0023782A8E|nr:MULTISPECIES: tRNA (adenosine(37)-N6)-threonylcarbamoyltransferase complex dimerization subunit type 1 TsaB [unclassified Aliivibrio]MDD9154632.1 tRNA (adenosine(37)-N6)-threonylcarbamoyltransferase complex dimerization subunit type 1 TsaB [Aliivibrio sp. S4TY2]MDD9159005.1 tRNA (adenosine(37)-N6)-threonylcarbamoyltransferase complex dimerization subunit type 1 TsaB [Aliivibrio sp. S4TY1]MDD9162635.1 tRNA (adenosine(37)-N6)-threonylcarbamoyltransferase complex dimerization subunit type 1 TsaB
MSAKILAVDTATENCSVALIVDGKVYSRRAVAPREHTIKVLPFVDEVLKEAGVRLQDLDALAFGQGPGSFTGVRIGIGIAQGLAFGADLPMIGISTLEAMAQAGYRENGATQVAAAIDARMGEVYFGMYQRNDDATWTYNVAETVFKPEALLTYLPEQSGEWLTVGTGWDAYAEALAELPLERKASEVLYPDAEDMAFLALQKFEQGLALPAEESAPVYVRDTVTWKKLPGRE